NGPFKSREQLQQVPGIGPARYVQAAGFLKIAAGDNPLDQTGIHPESYGVAQRLLGELGYGPDALNDRQKTDELREKLKGLSPEEVAARLEVGVPTLRDILEALARPGRDPREDLPPPIFRKGILKLEDLQPGMELKGTVLNVVDFGAFVDIGLKDTRSEEHTSELQSRFDLVCRLLLEKKKNKTKGYQYMKNKNKEKIASMRHTPLRDIQHQCTDENIDK